MKKINIFLFGILVAMTGFFSSCEKAEEGSGTLEFIGGGFIDQDKTVGPGETLNFKINATAETSIEYAEAEIETGSGVSQVKWSAAVPSASKNNYTTSIQLTAPTVAGVYKYTFSIYSADPNQKTDAVVLATKVINITVVEIATYTSKLLYDAKADNTSKTFFSSQTGETYTSTEAAANIAKIDFGFLYDQGYTTTKACLISVDQYSNSNNYSSQLTGTLNATIFKSVASASTYDNATTAASIASAYNAATSVATVTGYTSGKIAPILAEGNVLAFKTQAGKYGLIKIGTITRNNDDANNGQTMVINVKVQY